MKQSQMQIYAVVLGRIKFIGGAGNARSARSTCRVVLPALSTLQNEKEPEPVPPTSQHGAASCWYSYVWWCAVPTVVLQDATRWEHMLETHSPEQMNGHGSLARSFGARQGKPTAALCIGSFSLLQPLSILCRVCRDGEQAMMNARSPSAAFDRKVCNAHYVHAFIEGVGAHEKDIQVGLFYDGDGLDKYPVEVIRRGRV